jgi:hypothetical protein
MNSKPAAFQVSDCNFKLQHMKMRRPDDDVALRDGRGFMVESTQYAAHLQNTVEAVKVSPL